MLEQLQNELDNILKQEKELHLKKAELLKQVRKQGYFLEGEKLVEDQTVWILKWDMKYYNDYVPEKGPLIDMFKGEGYLSNKEYEEFLEAVKTKDIQKIVMIMWPKVTEDYFWEEAYDTFFQEELGEGQFKNDKDRIKWEVRKGEDEISQFRRGSYFEVVRSKKAKIDTSRNIFRRNVLED